MKKVIIVVCIGLASLMTTACVPKVESVDYNQKSTQLSLGMSKADVAQVLGQPRRTDVNAERERWIYWNKVVYGYTVVDNEQLTTERLTVTFVNGKVTKWGQQTLTDDMLESTQKTAQAYADAAKKP